MFIVQALFALISRSAGKILNAIFGWAVHALFGRTSSRQQTMLSGLVGAAVAWPILLVGVAAPKVAALLIAFVPIPESVPAWTIRLVWAALALIVPIAVGLAVTAKSAPSTPPESSFKRFLRGFPITLGLAIAFLIMFVSIPIMRLAALVRSRKTADVPLTNKSDATYHQTAATVIEVLNRHGLALKKAVPGWWVGAPMKILAWFGGNAFAKFVPKQLEHYKSKDLEVSFYTSGVLLRGVHRQTTLAHGLICESAAKLDAFLTIDPTAQRFETQIRRIWRLVEQEPEAHRASDRLLSRVSEIAGELGSSDIEYDEWQGVYRQLLQLERALRGQGQLLEMLAPDESKKGVAMALKTEIKGNEAMPANKLAHVRAEGQSMTDVPTDLKNVTEMSSGHLIKEITGQIGLLVKTQIDLAKTELQADLQAELGMVKGLGIGALAGIVSVNMLMVAGVFALAQTMAGWKTALMASAVTLGIAVGAFVIGWNKRVREPLKKTRQTLKEDMEWTKERLA